jgi:hypothetical protein
MIARPRYGSYSENGCCLEHPLGTSNLLMQRPKLMMRDRPRLACVIDPILALTQYGVSITQQLAQEMELWIAREFLHILDNPTFYLQHPGLVTPKGMGTIQYPEKEYGGLQETLRSLQEWQQFRRGRDLAGLNLFWLGDNLQESYLPKSRNLEIFGRWESIARSLDCKIDHHRITGDVIPLFVRDTVALAASLGSALILTCQRPADFEQGLPPQLCRILEHWHIPCQEIAPNNSMVKLERNDLRQLLVQTNAAKFLWADIRLAVLHLLISVSLESPSFPNPVIADSQSILEDSIGQKNYQNPPLIIARGFWYLV